MDLQRRDGLRCVTHGLRAIRKTPSGGKLLLSTMRLASENCCLRGSKTDVAPSEFVWNPAATAAASCITRVKRLLLISTRRRVNSTRARSSGHGKMLAMEDTMEVMLPPQTKIQVLLAEYSGLRNEIVQREGHAHQAIAVIGVVFLWLVKRGAADRPFWTAFAVLLLFGALEAWFITRDMYNAAARVCEIEEQVNAMGGEELLVWERKWGSHKARSMFLGRRIAKRG